MHKINIDLLTSNEIVHVKICKVMAWRNVLYALGVSESLIETAILDAGDGKLPSKIYDLSSSTYIILEAVEVVLVDLYANSLLPNKSSTEELSVMEEEDNG